MPKSRKQRKDIIPINKRQIDKGKIKSPFHQLNANANLQWSSWCDDYLPNMLWAAVCVGNLEREDALQLLREICQNGVKALKDTTGAQLGHNYLATLSYEVFEEIFSPMKTNKAAMEKCMSLTLVNSLPDHSHWKRFFQDGKTLEPLVLGIAKCINHQSQEATDVRWAKVNFMVSCGKVIVPPDHLQLIIKYPDLGDMRKVRPSIRAMEMAVRLHESGKERLQEVSKPKSEDFWQEMLQCTECIFPKKSFPQEISNDVIYNNIKDTLFKLCAYFINSLKTTSVDPRLEGAFGIALYMLNLALEVSASSSNVTMTGRIVLRTIIENYIVLKYLSNKDDNSIWKQYREYGSGQTALAFIKNSFGKELPDFIDIDVLEMLANEDAWFEKNDITIGNWANLNLRKMAIDAQVKDIYDSYYDWTSGFVHGHWGAIRDSSFTTCMNPLHRLHRVPVPSNPMPEVLVDCCKICNLALEEIGKLFPSFKPRIYWKTDNKS